MADLGELRDGSGLRLLRMYTSSAAARTHAFRVHYHTAYELGLVVSGHGQYTSDRKYEIRPGDIFLYKSGEPHCITDIAEPGMELLNLHISPIYFKHFSTERDENFGVAFLHKSFASNRLADLLTPEAHAAVSAAMRQIEAEFSSKSEGYELMIQNCLDRILILLSRAALASPGKKEVRCGNTERIFGAAAYIDGHYTEPLTLSELADSVRLEKTYFSALFKRIIGLSPCEYITVKRIEHAVRLLRTTDQNVLDVATACGFNNTANFNKLFKKYAGTVPKNIRKR